MEKYNLVLALKAPVESFKFINQSEFLEFVKKTSEYKDVDPGEDGFFSRLLSRRDTISRMDTVLKELFLKHAERKIREHFTDILFDNYQFSCVYTNPDNVQIVIQKVLGPTDGLAKRSKLFPIPVPLPLEKELFNGKWFNKYVYVAENMLEDSNFEDIKEYLGKDYVGCLAFQDKESGVLSGSVDIYHASERLSVNDYSNTFYRDYREYELKGAVYATYSRIHYPDSPEFTLTDPCQDRVPNAISKKIFQARTGMKEAEEILLKQYNIPKLV